MNVFDMVYGMMGQVFSDTVKLKADLGMAVGESIVPFHELPFITPRGRYEVEMFEDFFRMVLT